MTAQLQYTIQHRTVLIISPLTSRDYLHYVRLIVNYNAYRSNVADCRKGQHELKLCRYYESGETGDF